MPSLAAKRVSPHTLRHTTATHLLRSGVDINTIRAWLGHVSLTTTNVYAELDLEMKAKALAKCEIKAEEPKLSWREDQGLMEFLERCSPRRCCFARCGVRFKSTRPDFSRK
jgi:hypothetical protein